METNRQFFVGTRVFLQKAIFQIHSAHSPTGDSIRLNFNYKVVKAGLVVLSPCKLTKLILNLFEFYSIDPRMGQVLTISYFAFTMVIK